MENNKNKILNKYWAYIIMLNLNVDIFYKLSER